VTVAIGTQLPNPDRLSPLGLRLQRIHSQLPDNLRVVIFSPYGEEESQLREPILKATNLYRGDNPGVRHVIEELLSVGGLTATREEGQRVIRKGSDPKFPRERDSVRPGTDAFNAQLAKQAAEVEERHRENDQAMRRQWESNPLNPHVQIRSAVAEALAPLERRVAVLEGENSALRAQMRSLRRGQSEDIDARFERAKQAAQGRATDQPGQPGGGDQNAQGVPPSQAPAG
jgi:hypothetical protein